MTPSLAVIILTHNEEIHLARALQSVAGIASATFVIDSNSTDRTVEIARQHGAHVLQHPFKNQADQFRWALETVNTNAGWILRLDADEVIEPDLSARIEAELPLLGPEIVGITIDRKQIFLDRWIRHGGRYPLRLLRIFRKDAGDVESRWMDEHIVVRGGATVHFAGGFVDHNLNGLAHFTAKHNGYATREAVDVLGRRYGLFPDDEELNASNTSPQAATTRWIKVNLYNKTPFQLSALVYFLYRYVFQFGFLDGTPGLIYHFLQGFWYRFLAGAKIYEFDRALKPLQSRGERLAALRRLTGLDLDDGQLRLLTTPAPRSAPSRQRQA